MNISAWLPGRRTCSITEPFRGLSSCLQVLFTLALMQICCDSVHKVQTTLCRVACRDSLHPHLHDQHSLIADSDFYLETKVLLQFFFWEIAPEPLLQQSAALTGLQVFLELMRRNLSCSPKFCFPVFGGVSSNSILPIPVRSR